MDGNIDHRLVVENMTREEICKEMIRLVEWSLNTEFYVGKINHENYVMMDLLGEELELRMSAE